MYSTRIITNEAANQTVLNGSNHDYSKAAVGATELRKSSNDESLNRSSLSSILTTTQDNELSVKLISDDLKNSNAIL